MIRAIILTLVFACPVFAGWNVELIDVRTDVGENTVMETYHVVGEDVGYNESYILDTKLRIKYAFGFPFRYTYAYCFDRECIGWFSYSP
jgi:hypothetical protein